MNPLLDSNFLIKLNNDKNRTIYAHVISLNQYEHRQFLVYKSKLLIH